MPKKLVSRRGSSTPLPPNRSPTPVQYLHVSIAPAKQLVVGGAGYIGSTVVFRALTSTDWDVKVFDRLMYGGSSMFPFFGSMEDRFSFEVRACVHVRSGKYTVTGHPEHTRSNTSAISLALIPIIFSTATSAQPIWTSS